MFVRIVMHTALWDVADVSVKGMEVSAEGMENRSANDWC